MQDSTTAAMIRRADAMAARHRLLGGRPMKSCADCGRPLPPRWPAAICADCLERRITAPISPFVRRAMAAQLPPKELAR